MRRPALWGEALRALGAFVSRRWWTRAPFLPVPDAAHLGWRRFTAYGSYGAHVAPGDVVEYLMWRRRMRKLRCT